MSILLKDFCVGVGSNGGPESTVENALLEYGIKEDDLIYKSFLYYKNNCNGTEPWQPIVDEFQVLQDEMGITEDLVEEFNEVGLDNFTANCGTGFQSVLVEVNKVHNDFQRLADSFEQGVELARCDRVAPLYDR